MLHSFQYHIGKKQNSSLTLDYLRQRLVIDINGLCAFYVYIYIFQYLLIKFLSQESSEQIAVHCLKIKGYEVQEQQHKSNQLLRSMVSEEEEEEEEEDILCKLPFFSSLYFSSLSLSLSPFHPLSVSYLHALSFKYHLSFILDTEA